MAQGKLSPRQKMINMMYLIFIAMMALNMSKEVLSAFGLLNERLEESNVAAEARNVAFLENLATKATDEPQQYGEVKRKADQINMLSKKLDEYIQGVKNAMVERSPLKPEELKNYELQDQADYLDQLLFNGDKYTETGEGLLQHIQEYREGVLSLIGNVPGYENIVNDINKKFETEPVTRGDGVTEDWLRYHFEGFPMIASQTKMTQMQNDIKNTESEILQTMLAGQQAAALSFTQYNTLLESTKSAYYAGEQFDGSIVLGRKDPNTRPTRVELTLDGRELKPDEYAIEEGKVVLKINAGSPGDHKILGNLIFSENGEDTPIEVDLSFATISKPSDAVIAADKMNVVYRGVDNPMTISVPGVADNNVNASATGLSKVSGSKYVMRPGSGREVIITASATLPDGQKINTTSPFRIKDIPRPTGTVRGEDGGGGPIKMERQGLEIASVGATLVDFDFDLKLNVTSFSFKVAGQPTVRVNGDKLNNDAKSALRRAKRGETVQIYDINASLSGNSGYLLKKISPVFIELTN